MIIRILQKPMITFFGERSPAAVSKYAEEDMSKCDLIIVMGTSLKVGGAVVDLLNKARSDVVSPIYCFAVLSCNQS